MAASNRKGGRPKGRYALIAIMRAGHEQIVLESLQNQDEAIDLAHDLNGSLQAESNVIQYAVRAIGPTWLSSSVRLVRCRKCENWKPESEFYPYWPPRKGVRPNCKECHIARVKAWQATRRKEGGRS